MADAVAGSTAALRARALAAIILLIILPSAAQAHRLKVFALVHGDEIRGYVYFGGDRRAAGAAVLAIGPANDVVYRGVSGADGSFSFVPTMRVDYRVVADLGDGHRAEFVVPAAQLPPSLPADAEGEQAAAPVAATDATAGTRASGDVEPQPAASAFRNDAGSVAPGFLSPAEVEAMVDEAVARHVEPLREQLVSYEDKVRWHDVLGGLGYIAGITGLGAFLAGRRRRSHGAEPGD